MRAALLGLLAPARPRGSEELRQVAVAKGVAQHPEGARRVAEAPRHFGRRQLIHVEGAQGLVLALPRRRGLGEEAPQSVRPYGALIGTYARSHILDVVSTTN